MGTHHRTTRPGPRAPKRGEGATAHTDVRGMGLFTDEGVAAGVAGVSLGRGRGPLKMEVPTPTIQKTSTCLTLPSPALT